MQPNTSKSCSIIFHVNHMEFLRVHIPYPTIEQVQGNEILTGIYHTMDNQKLSILSKFFDIDIEIDKLIRQLTRSLQNQLEIDRGSIPDIGREWSQYLYNSAHPEVTWPGLPYLCFSTSDGPETFLYNEQGNIILEIIPTYPWLFGAKPKGIKKIPFKKFLETYKPYVRTIVPRERAVEWLETAQKLRNIIDRNESL